MIVEICPFKKNKLMRKLHFKPSEERDTAPLIESVIVLLVLGGIIFLIWLTENLI